MIKIEIFRTSAGRISGYTIRGHHGEYVTDIVCAGVSSLAQTALLGIERHLHREMDYEVASGDLKMKLKGVPDDLTEAILETMVLGLAEISTLYPKDVHISEVQEVES